MNKDKKADNLSYDKKKVIYDLDNKIYDSKKQIKELTKVQESLISLDFYINDCINLLSKSIKSEKDNVMYSDIQEINRKNLFNSLDIIESNVSSLKKQGKDLMNKKDDEIKKQDEPEIDEEEK